MLLVNFIISPVNGVISEIESNLRRKRKKKRVKPSGRKECKGRVDIRTDKEGKKRKNKIEAAKGREKKEDK